MAEVPLMRGIKQLMRRWHASPRGYSINQAVAGSPTLVVAGAALRCAGWCGSVSGWSFLKRARQRSLHRVSICGRSRADDRIFLPGRLFLAAERRAGIAHAV